VDEKPIDGNDLLDNIEQILFQSPSPNLAGFVRACGGMAVMKSAHRPWPNLLHVGFSD
jgi:hypothetical protein